VRAIIVFLAAVALCCPGILLSASWMDYVSTQDEQAAWASTVRGVIRGKTGIAVMQASASESYNFQPLLHSLAAVKGTRDLILPVGGLGSGRRADVVDSYIRMIRYDGGKRWRRLIHQQTREVAARFPGQHVYWQVGNEINSWHFGTSLSGWTDSDEDVSYDPIENIRMLQWDDPDERSQRKEERKQSKNQLKKFNRNNSDVISLYVEYFLAPTAEAIMDARAGGADFGERIKIVLGTIANSHNARAQTWLDSLLNYRIKGEFAPKLAGRKVSEVVDIIALHYMVSSPGPDWHSALRKMYGNWLGNGSITGIWSTEEIGKKRAMSNLGGASAISVLSRYTSLWNELGIDPSQGRVNFWGWNLGNAGTRADDAMQTLMRLVGDTPLTSVAEGDVILQSGGKPESYFFKTAKGQLVLVQFSANQRKSSVFNGFKTPWVGEPPSGITLIVFSASGQHEPEHEVTLENGWLTVSTPAVLSPRDAIMVVVDRD